MYTCRETVYHNPEQTQVAVVVVGGLCPGINDVIRAIVSKVRVAEVPERSNACQAYSRSRGQ